MRILWVRYYEDGDTALTGLTKRLEARGHQVIHQTWYKLGERTPQLQTLLETCAKKDCRVIVLQYPRTGMKHEEIKAAITVLRHAGTKVVLVKDGPWKSVGYGENKRISFPIRPSVLVKELEQMR